MFFSQLNGSLIPRPYVYVYVTQNMMFMFVIGYWVLCAASHWVSPSERYAVVPDETLSILANRLNQNASVSCDVLF